MNLSVRNVNINEHIIFTIFEKKIFELNIDFKRIDVSTLTLNRKVNTQKVFNTLCPINLRNCSGSFIEDEKNLH